MTNETTKATDATKPTDTAGARPHKFDGRIRDMTQIAIFAAIMCVLGPFSIYIGPIPLSFTTLVIYLMVYVLGAFKGTISVLVYILLGLVGLPVFSGFSGGPQKLLGATGGYIFGYLFIPLIAGAIITHGPKKYWLHFLMFIVATAVLYTFGTAWFIFVMDGITLSYALSVCVVPFIPGDLCKIILAMLLGTQIRKRLVQADLI